MGVSTLLYGKYLLLVEYANLVVQIFIMKILSKVSDL